MNAWVAYAFACTIDGPIILRRYILFFSLLCSCSLFTSFSATADLFEPISTSNLSPFASSMGLPATRSARTQTGLSIRTEIANNFTRANQSTEAIVLDGQTTRTSVSGQWQLGDRWSVGFELPYLDHGGGNLDGFIETWHRVFGLPNGRRAEVPQDQFRYAFSDGRQLIDLQRDVGGLGDLQLNTAYQLANNPERQWLLRMGIKLPTGDATRLTGSESTDIYVSLHATQPQAFGREDMMLHGSLGVLRTGNGELFPGAANRSIGFGSAAIVWRTWPRVSLKTQVDFHTAPFDSELKEVGEFSAQLVMGGSIQLGTGTRLDIGVSEDIVTDTAPDVAFIFELNHQL